MSIDYYIEATRRNLPNRTNIDYSHFVSLIDYVTQDPGRIDLKVCYSPERRAEIVEFGLNTYLIYDQYMGQTLSTIYRIVFENSDVEISLNYIYKVLAEFLAMKGSFQEAAIFARLHSFEGQKPKTIKKKTMDRAISVFYQERFICAHEATHHLNHRSKSIFESARDSAQKYFDHSGEQGWIDTKNTADNERIIDEMTCDMISLDAVSSTAKHYGHGYKVASIACIISLLSLSYTRLLRLAVDSYNTGNVDNSKARDTINKYSVRVQFLCWLCNNPSHWGESGRESILGDLEKVLQRYDEMFGRPAEWVSRILMNRELEKTFSADHAYVEGLIKEKSLSRMDVLTAVDAMCGLEELATRRMISNKA